MFVFEWVLGFFGYAKIPLEAIQLSIAQEDFIKKIIDTACEGRSENFQERIRENLDVHLRTQKALTEFLRSGKLLSG